MAAMIEIAPHIALHLDDVVETFVRATGPGGQHVNTTASAVVLRFDVRSAPDWPAAMQARLRTLAGQRMTRDGVIVIRAEAHRSQALNRAAALERLVALLRAAAERPAVRRPTRPTRASDERRLAGKGRRGAVKSLRRDTSRSEE